MRSISLFLSVFLATSFAFALEDRLDIFPSKNFDIERVEAKGLQVARDGDALVFVQEKTETWPRAVIPVPPELVGCSRIVIEAENTGKDLLKIRFAFVPPEFPTDRDKLMRLPSVELEPGEKKECEVALPNHPSPLDKDVLATLLAHVPPKGGLPGDRRKRSRWPPDAAAEKMTIFVYQTGQARTFRVTKIQAVGDATPPADFCTWKPDRFFPFIDCFGQFKHAEWPGKTHDIADMKRSMETERVDLEKHPSPPDWNRYGGWTKGPRREATGHFRAEKIEGKWWMIDPEGCLWWSLGPVRVTPSCAITPLDNREFFFEDLPKPDTDFAQFYETRDMSLHHYYTARGIKKTYDFSAANAFRKYGPDWRNRYADVTHRRLRSWGMNTIGNCSDRDITAMQRTPYTDRFELKSPYIEGSKSLWWKFNDPFHPDFRTDFRRQLAERKDQLDDPWCFGYFVDNEIAWGGTSDLGRWTLQSPASQPAKLEFVKRLKSKYKNDIGALNAVWKSQYADWDALLQSVAAPPKDAEVDCKAFTLVLAEAYFKNIRDEFKKVAPHKLYLGCRFHVRNPEIIRIAANYCDVLSYNIYRKTLDDFALPANVDKPVMVGEFHFGALDRGLFHPSLVEVENQEARGRAYHDYVESALRHPNFVGVHWHQYADQATSGRFEGENLQNGFLDVCDTPYPETIDGARSIGYKMYEYRYNFRTEAAVSVDASKILGPRKEIERFVNNSILMRSPPPELAARIVDEYGKPKIVRCWLCLDHMYDFKDKKFNFDYPIKNNVKGPAADYDMRDVPFEEYLQAFAGVADEILLNVRRFERKVVEGDMPWPEYKEVCKAAIKHYKTLCPNLRYIEALNEFHLQAFGNLTSKEYYDFYKIHYEIVNELNAELKPELPLLVGGPATTGFPPDRHLREFIELYAADTNAHKKLDFLSFHHYTNHDLHRTGEYETRLVDLLREKGVKSDIPFFWDEFGFTGTPWVITGKAAEDANRVQATCVTALQYHARNSKQLFPLPWVMFHSPSQTPLIQFKLGKGGDLVMTPFGMTVKCWGMQKQNELATESTGFQPNGFGLGAVGTADETGIAVLVWNHQAYACQVDLKIDNIPGKMERRGWTLRRFLIDSKHSNCFANAGESVDLAVVEEKSGRGKTEKLLLDLEPYAVTLIRLDMP